MIKVKFTKVRIITEMGTADLPAGLETMMIQSGSGFVHILDKDGYPRSQSTWEEKVEVLGVMNLDAVHGVAINRNAIAEGIKSITLNF